MTAIRLPPHVFPCIYAEEHFIEDGDQMLWMGLRASPVIYTRRICYMILSTIVRNEDEGVYGNRTMWLGESRLTPSQQLGKKT
jgi:hypothetical protein